MTASKRVLHGRRMMHSIWCLGGIPGGVLDNDGSPSILLALILVMDLMDVPMERTAFKAL